MDATGQSGPEAVCAQVANAFIDLLLLPRRIVQLHPPSWSVDAAELEAAFSPKTKLLVLNTPHNLTGKASAGSVACASASVAGSTTACVCLLCCHCASEPVSRPLQVFSGAELQLIADLCIRHNCLALLDEVYEHLVFPGGLAVC